MHQNMGLYGKFSQQYSQYPVGARASGGAAYPLVNYVQKTNNLTTYERLSNHRNRHCPVLGPILQGLWCQPLPLIHLMNNTN